MNEQLQGQLGIAGAAAASSASERGVGGGLGGGFKRFAFEAQEAA